MSKIVINTEFTQREIAYGVPRRVNRDQFLLKDALEGFSMGGEGGTFISVKKQLEYYTMACHENPGWLKFVCCTNDIETGRLIAANVVAFYSQERNYRSVWQNLGNNDNVRVNEQVRLVVIDALFQDSPAFRRDRVYDLITYHHDRPDTSILVICKTQHPEYISKVLGLRPNLALMVTK